ncbi:MAG TPA: DEAD/DEAH box helicase, partial [Planctomycetes bacterium]|nr:DEAD/DEAH box helicase [Planctomycetota bacterium]
MAEPVFIVHLPAGVRGAGAETASRLLVSGADAFALPPPGATLKKTADHIAKALYGKIAVAFDLPPKLLHALAQRDVYLWDASEIARILFAEADEFTAGGIAEHLGFPWPSDAPLDTARSVFAAFDAALETLPLAALETICSMLRPLGGTLTDYFEMAARKLVASGRSGRSGGVGEYRMLFTGRDARYSSPPGDETAARFLEDDVIRDFFAASGPLAAALDRYEDRPGQVEMATLAASALKNGRTLLVEAGTGVGKSLAYLLPAVAYSLFSGSRVVVATNTRTLQNQLLRKDVPVLSSALGLPFRAAMLKGRRNYLCIRKFFRFLLHGPVDLADSDRLALAALIPWALSSAAGDVSENTAFLSRVSPEALLNVTGAHEDCTGRQCRWHRACFLRRARAAAHGANLVIVNYALLMAAVSEEGELLPPFDDLILDEAHNVEDAATSAFSVVVARWRLRRFIRNVAGGAYGGLISAFRSLLQSDPVGAEAAAVASRLLDEAESHVSVAEQSVQQFFAAAADILARSGSDRIRHDAASRNPELFAPLAAAARALVAAVAGIAQPLRQAVELVEPLAGRFRRLLSDDDPSAPPDEKTGWTETLRELSGHLDMAAELIHDVDFVVSAREKDCVFWLEASGEHVELWATPVDVSGMLYETLYMKKRSVIFTSATLSVSGGFDFFLRRSGAAYAEDAEAKIVPSPFDYRSQSRLLVPAFLPDPGAPEFSAAFARMLDGAVRASDGRAMVLYTSHKMLAEVSAIVRPSLEASGFEVLQQEVDGPRDAILGRFRRNLRSVLFGTASFWEGVDVKGESLSLLILAKLPFPVHTDPLVAARQEEEE